MLIIPEGVRPALGKVIDRLTGPLETYLGTSPLMAILLAYVAGVVVSFTPCVYPLIPIVVAYIGARGGRSKKRSFLLVLFYVIGMGITFAALGVISALAGRVFGTIQANPFVRTGVGLVIVALGLVFLGVFTIPMPSFLTRGAGKKGKGGTLTGALYLGLASTFVAASCTYAVLGVLLAYVAETRNVVFGAAILFVFALGMGTLLILVGTFAGILKALPRSGAWLDRIEKVFGILIVLFGCWFVIEGGRGIFALVRGG